MVYHWVAGAKRVFTEVLKELIKREKEKKMITTLHTLALSLSSLDRRPGRLSEPLRVPEPVKKAEPCSYC